MFFKEKLILDKEKVQKVIISKNFTFKDEEMFFDFCQINGRCCLIKHDNRGKKRKFWITSEGGKPSYLLKYETRSNEIQENAGQYIMSGILKQLNFPGTEYLVTTFKKDGKYYDAILSKNYRETDDVVEISGLGLNNKFFQREFDNNMGQKPQIHHSVNFYIDVLKKLYGRNNINFTAIRRDLVKIALLQYVYVMSDLHFYNLSFMYNEKKGHKSMRIVPLYDCGNICTLNLSTEKIKNNLMQLQKTSKKRMVVDNFFHSKMPMFGIETELCYAYQENLNSLDICRPNCEKRKGDEKIKAAAIDLEIFREEITKEIIRDEEIAKFYEDIKTKVNIDEIYSYYNGIKNGVIPEYCAELVKEISKVNIKTLNKQIKKQKEQPVEQITESKNPNKDERGIK